jgi:hypothetical protein
MRIALILILSLFLSLSAYAADDDDAANRAKFEKECAAMIAPDGPCGNVVAGGGGRRSCVSKPENFEKATPACKAVIEEWRAMQKK